MARKKISEWKAKKLLSEVFGITYAGISTDISLKNLDLIDENTRYVVKVDEGIKKRMKMGLVRLNRSILEIRGDIEKFAKEGKEGYINFIIEPFVPHEQTSEKYLSIERVREGLQILYSEKGGIDVEENAEDIHRVVIPSVAEESHSTEFLKEDSGMRSLRSFLSRDDILEKLLNAFNRYYFSFLEINPLVVENGDFYFLDIAAEVDSAGEFFVDGAWSEEDLRNGKTKKRTMQEENVSDLSQKSQASFNLSILNPNGSIFMLLSGGGASIVLADEIYNFGYGKQIANYGEYSGNPNAEEVYVYTKNIIESLLNSSASRKVLLIGGGVANFTNISITFKGIIKALDERKEELKKQGVKVFVRRGGPNQKEGLGMMEKFLRENSLFGLVADQKVTLPEVVKSAVGNIKN